MALTKGNGRKADGFFAAYGMLVVLILICVYFSWATTRLQSPTGADGAETVASTVSGTASIGDRIVIVCQDETADSDFVSSLKSRLKDQGHSAVGVVSGDPPTVRTALAALAASGQTPTVVATTRVCANWPLFDSLKHDDPRFASLRIVAPTEGYRSTFLSASNLRNVADQIAVIAIIAIGMTMVIITGGIDLSVGSLIALSAVLTTWLIVHWGGGAAGVGVMLLASVIAVAVCGLVGAFSGLMVTRFRVPSFIATLAIMQVASGLAFIIAQGQSIYDIPPSFTGLGRGVSLFQIPNTVVLMAALYVLAHILMSSTALGRRIYASGGNFEAARLSGIRTSNILLFVYVISGLVAGLGGVIMASQLKAGAPTYGVMYELYVIAAVVVGGTSLTGGEGKIFGTLIGAFIIAVIRNGMNLMNVESYTQKVVLGLVILGAVLLDQLKHRRRKARPAAVTEG